MEQSDKMVINLKNKILGLIVFLLFLCILFLYFVYPYSYSEEKALKNGDVIVGAGGGNADRFYEFLQNVKDKQPDTIRITVYGKEGEPTIKDLDFNGKIIQYKEDSTRKYWGKHSSKFKGNYTKIIEKTNNNGVIDYYLSDEIGTDGEVWIYQKY